MTTDVLDESPPVVLTRTLPGSCAEIFAAWTEPEQIRLWLAPGAATVERAEVDPRPGGRFTLETRGPDGARHRITGRYSTLEPGRRIVQSWIYDGPLDLLCGVETELEVNIRAVGDDASELTLIHRRLSRADVRDVYRADWPTCFDKLQTALEP